jgi:hypothetical protein
MGEGLREIFNLDPHPPPRRRGGGLCLSGRGEQEHRFEEIFRLRHPPLKMTDVGMSESSREPPQT